MDGFGLDKPSDHNAVYLANTPYFDYLLKTYPNNVLNASGKYVGLPDGQMGNSEVGHLNLGAGRVVFQSLTRINKAIEDNTFFENKAFLDAINYTKKHNSKLHIFGLISDGGVHSYPTHIKALYDLAKTHNINPYLHAFMDGRDTPPTGGVEYIKDLVDYGINVSTVSGRYYAMDRDNNWDRIQKAFDNLVLGTGKKFSTPMEGLKASYDDGVTDEFVIPFVVNEKGLVENNDAIIFANFRPDRAIRLATAFSNPDATVNYLTPGKAKFDPTNVPSNLFFVSMMHYQETVKGEIAFDLQTLDNIYGDVIEQNNLKQLRIAETEKYAHVTFFFDGGEEKAYKGSKRILVESPKVKTYDLKPEMSAYEVRDKAVEAILSKEFDTMILNFANPDMVGHTGSIEAATKAVEAVDICVKSVVEAILEIDGYAIVLADHGNAEKMRDENGEPHTAHTTNYVPIIITKKGINVKKGALCDIAPTMLDLLNLKQPTEMTGKSLIEKK